MSNKPCRTQNYTTESTNVLFEQLNRMLNVGELATGEMSFGTVRLTTDLEVKMELGGNNTIINFSSPYGDMQPVFSALLVLGLSPKENAIIGLKPKTTYMFGKIIY